MCELFGFFCLNFSSRKVFVACVERVIGSNRDGSFVFAQEKTSTASESVWLQVIVGVGPVVKRWRVRQHRDGQSGNWIVLNVFGKKSERKIKQSVHFIYKNKYFSNPKRELTGIQQLQKLLRTLRTDTRMHSQWTESSMESIFANYEPRLCHHHRWLPSKYSNLL